MSNELPDLIDSTAPHDDGPVKEFTAHRAAARSAAARKSIAEALGKGKGDTGEPNTAPAAEPAKPEPAQAAGEPEPPDLNALRLRRQLAAERASGRVASDGPTFEDLLDKPGQTVRGWLESMRGDKFADDGEFKGEVKDLVSRLATDVLGVPLPASVRASLDSAAARKFVKHSRTAQSKRDAAAAERAERDQTEAQWRAASDAINAKLAGSESHPLLAAEPDAGDLVIELVKAAHERGERLGWEEAAKQCERYLRAQHDRRSSRLAPKKSEPAKVARVAEAEAKPSGPWTKDRHKAATLAMFRRGAKGSEP